jgi:hypothetical protein
VRSVVRISSTTRLRTSTFSACAHATAKRREEMCVSRGKKQMLGC